MSDSTKGAIGGTLLACRVQLAGAQQKIAALTNTAASDRDLLAIVNVQLAAKTAECERLRKALELCRDCFVQARQLVDGWWQTTPKAEWSEWDEDTRYLMMQAHQEADAALREGGTK